MKIVVDMNMSPAWIPVLRSAGHDAVHWSVVGAHDSPDDHIVSYAAETHSVILTRDLDFGAHLALSGGASPSVVQIRSRRAGPSRFRDLVLTVLAEAREPLADGALVVVDLERVRVRALPLKPSS